MGRARKLLTPVSARSIVRASADNFPQNDFMAENPALPCKKSRVGFGPLPRVAGMSKRYTQSQELSVFVAFSGVLK